jgi:fused signal recognition particle receptor
MAELVFGATGLLVFVVTLLVGRPKRRPAGAPALPSAVPPAATLREGLGNTRQSLWQRLKSAWERPADARLGGLEEALIAADVGIPATHELLRDLGREPIGNSVADLRRTLRGRMIELVTDDRPAAALGSPHVIVDIGVNGVGKTTTIAKMARYHTAQGRKVLLVAADTFRAAAADQLAHWADRLNIDCVRQASGSDPSAVTFDGMQAALARNVDVVIVDTAGRLHVKANLIAELEKLVRTIQRAIPDAPHEILLTIDATTGQNAIAQAQTFKQSLPLSGIILTKLDGTAKGGVVFAIRNALGLPIQYVGFGEQPEDFARFSPTEFVDAVLPESD